MSEEITLDRARFSAMTDGGAEDWAAIGQAAQAHHGQHVDNILAHLLQMKDDHGGFAVDRLEHSLQTATRAFRADRDEEYVVCALLHDIGDLLLPSDHAELGAAILKPYVSEQNHWMLKHHGIFQGIYFFHHIGLDREMREQFRGHPWFEYTADFCHLYDQNSFEPGYDTMPLEAFEPMMRRVMTKRPRSIYMPEAA